MGASASSLTLYSRCTSQFWGCSRRVRRLDGDNGSPGPAQPQTSGIQVKDWLG